VHRASILFGLTVPQTLNAGNVGRLVDEVRREIGAKRDSVGRLVGALRDRASRYHASMHERVRTSESAQALLATLHTASDADLVETLANAAVETSEAAVGRSIGQALSIVDALSNAKWNIFDAISDLQDHRRVAAAAITARLSEALGSEEHVIALKAKLEELERDAVRLLTVVAPPPSAPPPPGPQGSPPMPPAPPDEPGAGPQTAGPILVEEAQQLDLDSEAAALLLNALKERLNGDHELELSLSWRIARRSPQQ
jgi:hypothetical protein